MYMKNYKINLFVTVIVIWFFLALYGISRAEKGKINEREKQEKIIKKMKRKINYLQNEVDNLNYEIEDLDSRIYDLE